MWEENQKIINIINEKTFQPGPRTRKEEPRFGIRRGTLVGEGLWSRRDFSQEETLVKEGLDWNKMLFSFQQGQIANGFIHQMQVTQRFLH